MEESLPIIIVTFKGVDWWTLGILIYEMLASFPPFAAENQIDIFKKIIRGKIRFPKRFSKECCLLIKGLLHNKPTRRLGILKGGADNIRNHAWYKHFNWNELNNGSMIAPIVNTVKNRSDLSNFAKINVNDDDAVPIDPKDDFDSTF